MYLNERANRAWYLILFAFIPDIGIVSKEILKRSRSAFPVMGVLLNFAGQSRLKYDRYLWYG